MSWFIGFRNIDNNKDMGKIHSKSNVLHSGQIGEFYFQAGGIPETCRYLEIAKKKMLVLGLPINNDSLNIVNKEELLLCLQNMNFSQLTGAYTLIIFANSKIKIIGDKLNLRKIYYYQQREDFILSTEIFWIKSIMKLKPALDSLGIYWNLGHAHGDNGLFGNVKTITGDYSLEVDSQFRLTKQEVKRNKHLPEYDAKAKEKIKEKLSHFIYNLKNTKLSLSLSGGLDSRTILAYLMQNNNHFISHTFGEAGNYDVIIAKQLAKKFNFANINYDNFKQIDKYSFVEDIQEFIRETEMTQSLVSFPLYDYFKDLKPRVNLIIDGGFVCYLRRVTNNKIIMFNRQSFINNDVPKIYSLLKLAKADVFLDDIQTELDSQAQQHLNSILAKYKISPKTDIGDWLDLIKFRLMNSYYFAPSQRRYDEFIPNLMVGAQGFFTDLVFSIPPKERKDYKINREIIKSISPKLMNMPYARYNTYVKSLTTANFDFVKAKINQKLGHTYNRSDSHFYLGMLEEWLNDKAKSVSVTNSNLLDHKKIKTLLSKYYHRKDLGQANNIMKMVQIISFLDE